jgi:hypothetical protein
MTDMVANAYATMATFRTFVRNSATSDATDPDSAIELLALESAARAIERATNRVFTATIAQATARTFTATSLPGRDPIAYMSSMFPASWYRHYILEIHDLADTTGMTVSFDSTGNGDYDIPCTAYRVGPTNNPSRGLPYTRILFDTGTYPPMTEEGIQVTAKWGWSAVPTTIQNANLIQAARFLKRRDAAFGIAGSPEMGNELRLLSKLDPDVAVMVGAYKRNWGAV